MSNKENYKLNITVDSPLWHDKTDFEIVQTAQKMCQMTFDYFRTIDGETMLKLDKVFEINLCLSDDLEVRRLNKEFRGKDKPTNVLSFANVDDVDFDMVLSEFDEIELGDIILSFETLEKEAKELDILLYNHYCHLLVHGFLHLLGYDHMDEEDALEMEEIEANILALVDIENPYEDEA